MINRRDLLKGILATGIAPAFIHVEHLMKIVVPKTIIPIQGNHFLSTEMITREALKILRENLMFNGIASSNYTKIYSNKGGILIRRPYDN